MYKRHLKLSGILAKKSIFLLGPRQCGKSTLLRSELADARTYNLLDAAVYRALSADPTLIRKEFTADKSRSRLIVIDEIQRLPELLNEVHLLIEEHGARFALTGSSARSLRRKGVNLLAGRARTQYMHPLTSAEIGPDFDLLRALNHGLLPPHYDSNEPDAELGDYAGTYLREEIAAEGLSRNIPQFSRFLQVAALSNGTMINHTNIASDAEVKRTTVIDYFQVLYDTLLAFELPAWRASVKRKAVATSKFYLFDPGLQRHLAGFELFNQQSAHFGPAFEHFIFRELRSALDYGHARSLHYWRSTSQFEVDFLVDERVGIEVKASATIRNDDLKGLRALREDIPTLRAIVVYTGDHARVEDGIEILPWREFLAELWKD